MVIYSTNDLNPYSMGVNTTTTASGDIEWENNSVWLNADAVEFNYSYIPNEIDAIPVIQGEPKGAKWLVSWAYKRKDPVAFFRNKNDMLRFVATLREDERVIQKSIIIHKISGQYRPKEIRKLKRLWVKEVVLKRE